jgi:hypothetical protein
MDKFSKLTEYQLLEIQDDLKTIFMIKKNNYIRDLDKDEIEEIKYYKRLFKKISNELEDIDI